MLYKMFKLFFIFRISIVSTQMPLQARRMKASVRCGHWNFSLGPRSGYMPPGSPME